MWFDVVLIDKLYANGALVSAHIRAGLDNRFAVDRLEDINPDFRAVNTKDFGPLRVYEFDRVSTAILESQLRNFVFEPHQITVQLDHFGIPVVSGYYGIIFPKGWRVAELKIYDPYDKNDNLTEKRGYRGVDVIWDQSAQMSCAQFNMESKRRGTFSIGVIASLCPANAAVSWIDRPGQLAIDFTDPRHAGTPDEKAYRSASNAVVRDLVKEPVKAPLPGINVSLSGPSINIVEWARYLAAKVRNTR